MHQIGERRDEKGFVHIVEMSDTEFSTFALLEKCVVQQESDLPIGLHHYEPESDLAPVFLMCRRFAEAHLYVNQLGDFVDGIRDLLNNGDDRP